MRNRNFSISEQVIRSNLKEKQQISRRFKTPDEAVCGDMVYFVKLFSPFRSKGLL